MTYRCPECKKDTSLYESRRIESTGYYALSPKGERIGRLESNCDSTDMGLDQPPCGCGECGWEGDAFEEVEYTESGRIMTDEDFEALADEAEKGYDPP